MTIWSTHTDSDPATHSHDWVDNFGKNNWNYLETVVQDKNNTVKKAILHFANSQNGENVLYDISIVDADANKKSSGNSLPVIHTARSNGNSLPVIHIARDNATIVFPESQDFSEKRDRYEAKQRYVDRRNAESRENAVGLSEEQMDALEWLARTRHEIHSSPERFRNPEAGGTTWNYFDDDSLESINNHLTSAGLEPIDFGDYTDIPTADDYYSILSDEEREEWESYAEENRYDSGLSAWRENSGDYKTFVRAMERINKSTG